jgi:hypothetical protein
MKRRRGEKQGSLRRRGLIHRKHANTKYHGTRSPTACLVFIDAWMMRSHGLDSVCGYMCMCALALLTQPLKQRCAESTGGFLWFEDFAWSFVSTFEVVSSVSGMCIPVPFVLKISIGCALAVFHVIGSCASIGALEMVLRAVIFYVMCAVSVMCLKFTGPKREPRPCARTMQTCRLSRVTSGGVDPARHTNAHRPKRSSKVDQASEVKR